MCQEADSERYGLTMRMFELGAKALSHPSSLTPPSTT